MQFFKEANFNFVGNRNIAMACSGLLILATVVSVVLKGGLNMSIDFAGGTLVQLKFEKPVGDQLGAIRSSVSTIVKGTPEIKTIGRDGTEIQVIVKKQEDESSEGVSIGEQIQEVLQKEMPGNTFSLRRQEKVGPKVGGELQQQAFWAIILSLVAIVIYIGIRFHLPFGIAAIVALFHDVVITIGVFSVANVEFSLPIIAALLTIVGYSLNDTIVVFDRIRENLAGGSTAKKSFEDRVNSSINQTLSRTIITSLTTLFVVVALFVSFVGSGDVLSGFAGALLVGVIVGTYSSMFIASPVLVLWNKKWPIK